MFKQSMVVWLFNFALLVYIDAISKSDHQVSGEVSCGTQYHFHMETQVH